MKSWILFSVCIWNFFKNFFKKDKKKDKKTELQQTLNFKTKSDF